LIAPVTISAGDTGDQHDPVIGGDMTVSAVGITTFFVVWQRELSAANSDIHARHVQGSGGLVAGSIQSLAGGALDNDTHPAISKTNGIGTSSGRTWTIAFEHEITSTNHDIRGALVRADGVVTATEFDIATTATDEREPAAAELLTDHGAGRPWLLAYEFGSSLRLAALNLTSVQDTLDLTPSLFSSFGEPDVTSDGRLWQFAFRSSSGVFPSIDRNVQASTASFIAGELTLAEPVTNIASSTLFDATNPRIASTFGSPNAFRTYIAYQTESASNLSDIEAGVYDSPITAGDFNYCFGTNAVCPCGNGGTGIGGCENSAGTGGAALSATGQWFLSGDTAVLNVSQLPPGAPLLYFQGTAQNAAGSPFGDGLFCVAGTITRMAVKFSSGGVSSFPQAGDPELNVAGLVPVTGGFRYYQAWHRDGLPFCTAALFNLTNGVALLWAP
jgi:hypothetical protein